MVKAITGGILAFLGVLGAWSAIFIWIGYSLYQVLKTDLGFFDIVLPNLGYGVLQFIVSYILVLIGAVLVAKSK